MRQKHSYDSGNQNHLFERKHRGGGIYFQRGICKGIQKGDEFYCFTEPKRILVVDETIKVYDAKGNFKNENDKKDACYEAILKDPQPAYGEEMTYIPLRNI